MKRAILISTLILSVTLLNAQFSIGPTAGYGHSWYTNDDVNVPTLEYQFHPHMNAGIEMLYSFSGPMAISAAFKYSGEGATYTYQSSGNSIKAKTRASYFRIPLQVVYHFGDAASSVRPRISAGPSFGFLTGGKQTVYVDGNENLTQDSKDFLETFDFGINTSAGVVFKVGQTAWLSTVVNYYHGLSNMYKTTNFDVESRNLGLNVGLHFPLGGSSRTTTTTTTQ